MAILFTRVLMNYEYQVTDATRFAALLGTIVGSNIGALLVPIGCAFLFLNIDVNAPRSLAGMMWTAVLRSHQVISITNRRFIKIGLIVAPIVTAASCAVLSLQLHLSFAYPGAALR